MAGKPPSDSFHLSLAAIIHFSAETPPLVAPYRLEMDEEIASTKAARR